MTEENKAPEQAAAQEAPKGAPTGPDLTVQDLQALKSIIDVASKRGAFQAAEMEVVGKTYNRLNTFLEAVTPKNEGDAPAQAPATEQPAPATAEAPKE
jgi:hypothetical protein